jgi:hypothetical protein
MEESKNLGLSLIDSVGKPLVDEIGLDLSEVLLDGLLKDGILKEIPIVGTILGMSKAAIRLKDYLFIKKVLKFLAELSSVSFEEKEEFLGKYDGTDEERELGETLILCLDRHENFKKPALFAKVFKAYVRNRLTNTQFHILATAIDRAVTQDIETFVELFQQEHDFRKHDDYYQIQKLNQQKQDTAKNLYSAGLSTIDLEIERGKSFRQAAAEIGIADWSGEPGNIKQIGVSFVLMPEAELLARAILDIWE